MWNKCVNYPSSNPLYANCLAWEIIDINQGACRQCKKGYTLNAENHFCEKLTVPTCSQHEFRNPNLIVGNNRKYFLYLNQHGSGCYQCNSGMVNLSLAPQTIS